MWNDIIDAILIINLDDHHDRWNKISHSFAELGLADKIHRIPAVKGSDLPGYNQYPWFRKRTVARAAKIAGAAGCVLSHAHAIRFALRHPEWKTILVLEDDAVPCREKMAASSALLTSFVQENDWDMIYPGHTGTSRHYSIVAKSETGSPMILRTDGVLGTFAMLIHRRAWQKISDSLPTEETVWPWIAINKASDYWIRNRFSPFAKTYILTPDPILHDHGVSSISQEIVDSPPEIINPDAISLSREELENMLDQKAPLKKLKIMGDKLFRFLSCRFRGFSGVKKSSKPKGKETSKISLALLDTYNDEIAFKYFLQKHFDIDFIDDYRKADYVIYGDFGFRHPVCKGVKIFLTGENHKPDLNACDFALTHEELENERCFRLPYWMQCIFSGEDLRAILTHPRTPLTRDDLELNPRKFCNFVYKNKACKRRNRFFHRLSKYKRVDSAGPLFNNSDELTGERGDDIAKIQYLSKFKFTIAFENESHPGYQTEKVMHPLMARSVPIYWGNPSVANDFNPKAIICADDYPNDEALIDHIRKVDKNDDLLLKYLNQPVFTDEKFLDKKEQELVQWFQNVFSSKKHRRSRKDKIMFWISQFYGHAAPYHLRRFMRYLRGK